MNDPWAEAWADSARRQSVRSRRPARLRQWAVLLVQMLAARLWVLAYSRIHATTDPACERFQAPDPGSRLDRLSRSMGCSPCTAARWDSPGLAWIDEPAGWDD